LNKWGSDCHLCKKPIDLQAPRATFQQGWESGLQLDHVIPISSGGPDTLENVKPSHGKCNIAKGYRRIKD
jgi:5-methylcytosine-specific restriction endonuclease McrA